jgi:hypothetical protein
MEQDSQTDHNFFVYASVYKPFNEDDDSKNFHGQQHRTWAKNVQKKPTNTPNDVGGQRLKETKSI